VDVDVVPGGFGQDRIDDSVIDVLGAAADTLDRAGERRPTLHVEEVNDDVP
jgi:hypothetical protein